MSEKILKALMQLFAIIAKQDVGMSLNERQYVHTFLKLQLSEGSVNEYLQLFDSFVGEGQKVNQEGEEVKLTSVKDSVKTLGICKKINKTLTQKQKIVVLVRLLEMIDSDKNYTTQRMAIIDTVAEAFNITKDEFDSVMRFITKDDIQSLEHNEILIIKKDKNEVPESCKFIESLSLTGLILFLRVPSVDLYFVRYIGSEEVLLNGLPINDNRIFIFANGSILKPPKGKPTLYSDVVQQYIKNSSIINFSFDVNNLNYSFPSGQIGLRNISLHEKSGKLVGIMGSSGAGKTTLLNVLCGLEKPSSGEVLINNINLHKENKKLKGIIGYVPQDDLLIEELTVFENLYYNAKLVFRDFTKDQINNQVNNVLSSLGLGHIKHLKVGNPLNKKISGGQRKRLNIGLELLREPAILFLDEPTSGLSSRDSENVMELLSDLTIKGKLIFTVIHQPSSNIYKLFDSIIIIDVGGYPVYYGNPIEAVMYFKKLDNQINSDIGECSFCGNVNPESIFNVIEARILDDYGEYTDNRKVSPQEWAMHYEQYKKEKTVVKENYLELPEIQKIPTWFQQLKTFFLRDLFSKIANTQYLVISLIEAPIIGFILAFILRYISNPETDTYIFRDNDNIMPYMFMSTIVAIFLGLMVSAEEIFKDRKILKREKFLNLSRSSYLFSKIGILFLLSAIQAILFVLIGNYILEIHGMYFQYWMVFFSIAAFANVLGLNISSAFDSAVTIYILIPFLIIPQMVLSGAMFSFDKINSYIGGGSEKVPILAELMPSRWAFEAMVVNQFVNNDYQKLFYDYEKKESQINYYNVYLLPEIKQIIEKYKAKDSISGNDMLLVKNELAKLTRKITTISFSQLNKISPNSFNEDVADSALLYIENLQDYFKDEFLIVNEKKDQLISQMQSTPEKAVDYQKFYDSYYNKYLGSFVKNMFISTQLVRINNHYIQKIDPIYLEPQQDSYFNFRTHFMAPVKHFMNYSIPTFWFNIFVMWFMTILMYVSLYFEWISKLFKFTHRFKTFFKKSRKFTRKKSV